MKVTRSPAEQFTATAADYATFAYHAKGPDLAPMLEAAALLGHERVLDLGCGPGHTALLFATRAREVIGLDPTATMLEQARRLATVRGLGNLRFVPGSAEELPFANASFDCVTSRQSAHHYSDLRAALREIARVLRPDGSLVLVDTVAPEDDALDEFLNRVELLRDPSHVRDYRLSQWREMMAEVGFSLSELQAWRIPLEFESWVKRSRTAETDIAQLRSCFAAASQQTRDHYRISPRCNWAIPVGLVLGRRSLRFTEGARVGK